MNITRFNAGGVEAGVNSILPIPTDWPRLFIERRVTQGELLGSGYYSSVFDVVEDDDSVIKYSPHSDDTVQYLLLAFILEHSTKGRPAWMPHVKAVYGTEKRIEFYIEKLTPLDRNEDLIAYDMYLNAVINYSSGIPGLFDDFRKMQAEVFNTTSSDLHEGNVMLRGSTLVITDPFSGSLPQSGVFQEYLKIAQQVAPKYADVQRIINGA